MVSISGEIDRDFSSAHPTSATGNLPITNGFGVFIPKSVSGSGEAMFKHAYIGGMEALVGGRNLAWKFMVLECTSSMGSVTCTRLPTCLTDVGFGQRFT